MFTRATALRALFASACVCGTFTATAGAAQFDRCPGSLDVPKSEQDLGSAADAIVCLVNAERTSRGMRPLRADTDLKQAARRHANDMVRRKYFAHTSPSGNDVGDRIRAAGYGDPGDGWRVGENLGWGTGQRATPNWIVDAWLASPPHRRIMLRSEYRELGVGVADGAPKPTGSRLPGATYALDVGVLR